MNNWTGMPAHRTDDFIHWSTTPAKRKKEATEYQTAYAAIEKAGLQAELELLLDGAVEHGRMEEWEANADASL